MKLFIQTRFYQFVSPFIYQLIPTHPARYFWTRILLAFLLSRGLEWIIDLTESILGSPVNDTWQYYTYLTLETIRYGCWFWSIWYGLVQTINFTLAPHPKFTFSAVNVAFLLTWIFVMGTIEYVNRTVEPTYNQVLSWSLGIAFVLSVGFPTCFGPNVSSNIQQASN